MATEAELIEQKREERKKLLEEVKARRAAAAQVEGSLGAAEQGQYGDVGQGGPKGEFDDEINQDPENADPSRFSMANLKKAILGEGGGLESLMYFLPGTGDVMSAQDSVRAAKAAQQAENIVDKIKLYGLSGLAAAGALPVVSAIYDAGGPAVKRMIDQAIKQAEKISPQPSLAGTPGVMNVDETINMNVLKMSENPKESGNEFFDYGYRVKPSDKSPTNPLGELKEAEFNRLKKEIESPKISKGENIVIDTSVREQPTTEIISGSFDGINKRLPLKTKVKEGGSKVYRRKEEISDPYLNNISKNEKITDYFEKIGEGSDHQTFLIRAHQLEQSAVGKIKKAGFSLPRNFSIYEMIPQKQLKYMLSESRNYDPRYAQTISTQTRNREHQKAGGDLIAQLVTKYDAMGYTFKPFTDKRGGVWVFNKNKVKSPEKIEEINAEMVKSIDKINDLKVPVMFYNPAKNRMVTYGEPPKNVSVDLRKSVEEKGYAHGGMVGISHLTRPL